MNINVIDEKGYGYNKIININDKDEQDKTIKILQEFGWYDNSELKNATLDNLSTDKYLVIHPLIDQNKLDYNWLNIEYLINLENNIKYIIKYQIGSNDNNDWLLYAKLKNGYWLWLKAWSSSNGFDYNGSIEISVNKNKDYLIKYGIDYDSRKKLNIPN